MAKSGSADVGSRVWVCGLTSSAGHALNGRNGRVVSHDAASGRFEIEFEGTPRVGNSRIQPGNLVAEGWDAALPDIDDSPMASASGPSSPSEIRVGSRVRVRGLTSSAGQALNGRNGRVVGHDAASGRFEIEFEGTPRVGNSRIKPGNLVAEGWDAAPLDSAGSPILSGVSIVEHTLAVARKMLAQPSAPKLEGRNFADPGEQTVMDLVQLWLTAVDSSQTRARGALKKLRRRADQAKDPIAQYMCGKLLRDLDDGLPWAPDLRAANRYWAQAARAGFAYAESGLANVANDENNTGAAIEGWGRALATAALPEAAYHIGVCYGLGHNGTPVDLERAARFYKHAQNADVSEARGVNTLILNGFSSKNLCQTQFTSDARRNLAILERKLGREVTPFPTAIIVAESDLAHHSEVVKKAKAVECLREIINDPDSSAQTRDFARMQLATGDPMPQSQGMSRGTPITLEESTEQWQRVQNFETRERGDPVDAVHDAAAAILFDEKKIPLRAFPDPKFRGKPNPMLAYPRLTSAARDIISAGRSTNVTKATANVVLSFLHMHTSPPDARKHLNKAIALRPNNQRQLELRGAVLAVMDLWPLSLEDVLAARGLATDPQQKWSLGDSIGKCLLNLDRKEEAVVEFEAYVRLAFVDQSRKPGAWAWDLDPGSQARVVSAMYILVDLCSTKNGLRLPIRMTTGVSRGEISTSFYQAAQEHEDELSAEAQRQIDGPRKMLANVHIVHTDAATGRNRECNHCRRPSLKLKQCGGCKAVAYCGRECQLAAWESGHKLECTTEKKKVLHRKAAEARQITADTEVLCLPPIDASLRPITLWEEAVALSAAGEFVESAWKFLVALFMDFSLDGSDLVPLRRTLSGCAASRASDRAVDAVAVALEPIAEQTIDGKYNNMDSFQSAHQLMEAVLPLSGQSSVPRTLADQDRVAFATACADLFYGRILGRGGAAAGSQTLFDNANRLVRLAADHLVHPSRYLTMQFELGYSNRDIGAQKESLRWYDMLLGNQATCASNPHWQQFLARAEHSVTMIRDPQRMVAEWQDRLVSNVRRQRQASAHDSTADTASHQTRANAHKVRAVAFFASGNIKSAEKEYTLAVDAVHEITVADSSSLPAEVQLQLTDYLANRAQCRLILAAGQSHENQVMPDVVDRTLVQAAADDCQYARSLPHFERSGLSGTVAHHGTRASQLLASLTDRISQATTTSNEGDEDYDSSSSEDFQDAQDEDRPAESEEIAMPPGMAATITRATGSQPETENPADPQFSGEGSQLFMPRAAMLLYTAAHNQGMRHRLQPARFHQQAGAMLQAALRLRDPRRVERVMSMNEEAVMWAIQAGFTQVAVTLVDCVRTGQYEGECNERWVVHNFSSLDNLYEQEGQPPPYNTVPATPRVDGNGRRVDIHRAAETLAGWLCDMAGRLPNDRALQPLDAAPDHMHEDVLLDSLGTGNQADPQFSEEGCSQLVHGGFEDKLVAEQRTPAELHARSMQCQRAGEEVEALALTVEAVLIAGQFGNDLCGDPRLRFPDDEMADEASDNMQRGVPRAAMLRDINNRLNGEYDACEGAGGTNSSLESEAEMLRANELAEPNESVDEPAPEPRQPPAEAGVSHSCTACGVTKLKVEYSQTQWKKRAHGLARCKACVAAGPSSSAPPQHRVQGFEGPVVLAQGDTVILHCHCLSLTVIPQRFT
jgi:tetratricopeptide (TPR) repeat protein